MISAAAALFAAVCLCGEAPERANDFFWENDRTGFRAYGPGDAHKWSGIDVFNKMPGAEITCGWLLRNHDKCGNWHTTPYKGILDNYAVGPGRGVGGVAFRKDGKWLPDYGNWVAYRIRTNCEERCAFELDYKLPIGGTMTLGIGLAKGCSLFVEEVKLSDDVPTEGLEVGVGLDLSAEREHTGDIFIDEKKLIVSLFEKPRNREGEKGSMMNAVFAVDARSPLSLVDGPDGSKLVMTRPLCKEDAGKCVVTVMAGADWTEAGRFKTAAEWHGYVQRLHGQFEEIGARIGAKAGEVIGKAILGIIGGVVGAVAEAAATAQAPENFKPQQKGTEK